MKKMLVSLLMVFSTYSGIGQGINCETCKDDSLYYRACLLYTEACEFPQGSDSSQILLDKAIEICPYFSSAYYVRAIPFLKRGEFITWKVLIDKAVQYNPQLYLGYRGGARFMFLRDFLGAIRDIEKADSICAYDIGFIYNGDYHLQIIRALIYRGLGDNKKAIEIIEKQLKQPDYLPGPFDYLHLGVLYLEFHNYQSAIDCLKKQIEFNDSLAEAYYYLALTYQAMRMGELFSENITKAKDYYLKRKRLPGDGSYMDYVDKVYLSDFEVSF
ncbi:MAG: hypothetical protein Q7J34_12330 [Bacteroidales bacterium]|nr:hypothetical protein [Bacteroidales bacterium]